MRALLGRVILFLPASAFIAACGASTRPLARQSLSVDVHATQMGGCYQLVEGGGHLPAGTPPSPVILLDSVPLNPGESPRIMLAQVLTADSIAWPATTLSRWSIDATDANLIHLWLRNGFERSGLTLRRTADTLDGSVRRFADFPKVYLTHRVRAIRVRCPE